MIDRASKVKRDKAGTHYWVGAAYVPIESDRAAALVVRYGHMKVNAGQEIDVADVMCWYCRLPHWKCFKPNPETGEKEPTPCPRSDDATAHLRGGTPGVRKKRGGGDDEDATPIIAMD